LDLYGRAIDAIEGGVRTMLGRRVSDRLLWAGMKAVYSGLIAGRTDWELAETFFNSVTRRIFTTVGVDSNIEFVDSDFAAPSAGSDGLDCRVYRGANDAADLVEAILRDAPLDVPFSDTSPAPPLVSLHSTL